MSDIAGNEIPRIPPNTRSTSLGLFSTIRFRRAAINQTFDCFGGLLREWDRTRVPERFLLCVSAAVAEQSSDHGKDGSMKLPNPSGEFARACAMGMFRSRLIVE
tara:strand:+ start:9690 stop:10001 length:312 start_codon:yes stop_codon:yes gene_type:complete